MNLGIFAVLLLFFETLSVDITELCGYNTFKSYRSDFASLR